MVVGLDRSKELWAVPVGIWCYFNDLKRLSINHSQNPLTAHISPSDSAQCTPATSPISWSPICPLTLYQPQQASQLLVCTPGTVLPQGLGSDRPFCLENSSPRSSHVDSFSSVLNSKTISLPDTPLKRAPLPIHCIADPVLFCLYCVPVIQ